MTIEEVRNICAEAFSKEGFDFNAEGIEVKFNGRLTRTLGRCSYIRINDVVLPAKIEISRNLNEYGTREEVEQTILHECGHALAALETGERQGHNSVFKAICGRIGCYDAGSKSKVSISDKDELYKYSVFCSNDGFLRGYSRMCSTLKNLSNCYCPKCKQMKLYYVQNK